MLSGQGRISSWTHPSSDWVKLPSVPNEAQLKISNVDTGPPDMHAWIGSFHPYDKGRERCALSGHLPASSSNSAHRWVSRIFPPPSWGGAGASTPTLPGDFGGRKGPDLQGTALLSSICSLEAQSVELPLSVFPTEGWVSGGDLKTQSLSSSTKSKIMQIRRTYIESD